MLVTLRSQADIGSLHALGSIQHVLSEVLGNQRVPSAARKELFFDMPHLGMYSRKVFFEGSLEDLQSARS